MPELIHKNLGPYRILEMIGRGGMAIIYKAYHPSTDRLVAIKVLLDHRAEDPQTVRRFEHEARMITGLEHGNIVPVYDFGRDGEMLYLVMRYMRAGTVNDLLKRDSLTVADALSILTDVASALDYAHRQNIIHRDIKPNNILVDAGGRANLTDFGLAKVLNDSFDLTRSGTAMGTPAYMAPEQVAGGEVSARTDIYALGVMLYEMVTGVLPFTSDSPMAVAMMHLRQELRPARQINPMLPESVEAVIERAMNKEPGQRFTTAGEMAAALTQAVGVDPMILTSKASDRRELATLIPARSTLHLIDLATTVAETKSTDKITPELRRTLHRQERQHRLRPFLAFVPWTIAGILIISLTVTLITVVRASADSRTSAAGTSTAVQVLVLQLSEAQTAIASGGGADAQSTLAQLQTQIAGAFTVGPTSIGSIPTLGSQGTPTSRPGSTSIASTSTSVPSTSVRSTTTSAPPAAATNAPQATPVPAQPTSAPAQPTSAPPQPTSVPPQPTSILPPVVNTVVQSLPIIPNIIPSLPILLP
jgi:serine/threonine protein kinase